MAVTADRAARPRRDDTFQRHAGIDRLFHWLTAACVLTLMATGLLPHMGVRFAWLDLHWITGLGLTLLVAFHLGRSFFWKKVRTVWFTMAELRAKQVGKYSIAQKLMHHGLAAIVLAAVITGLLMLKNVQTPLLARNPALFSGNAWGWIYVVHGLAAAISITLVMIHVYFGVIPENRMYLRAMITGRMSRADQRARVAAILNGGRGP